ncbi:MAG TPA: MFS transporter [Deinococcales bacterium]|nr:MFS transporter [Deinococcales bacterium]
MRSPGFPALRNASFRNYWVTQLISLVGTWMQNAAQSWLVINNLFGHNPAEGVIRLGVISALQFTPSLLLCLFAGAILDRVSRRKVLVLTQTVLMFTALVLATAVLTGAVTYTVVAVLAFVSGVAQAFDMTARQSIIPSLVPRADLPNAVALNSMAFNTARILGYAVFGLLSPLLGLPAMFYANGASFVFVILVLARLEERPVPGAAARRPILQEILDGLKYVAATPAVFWPMTLLLLLSLTVINFNIFIPTFARNELGLSETGFGLLGTSFGVGAVLGALMAAGRQRGASRYLLTGAVLLAAFVTLLAVAPSPLVASVILALAGLGMILFTISVNSTVQLNAPEHFRGRVMSVYSLVFAGSAPFGSLIVSGAMGALGSRTGIALVGVAAIVTVLAIGPRTARLARAGAPLVETAGSPSGAD